MMGILLALFFYFSKAFDIVNHRIFLDLHYNSGVIGNMHKLLASYLQNRKRLTVCNITKFQINTIMCGVPQGSTLGLLWLS